VARTHPGGAEIELSLLFADVRGSSTLAERMSPAEFSQIMNRFYAVANNILISSDALIDKLVGDEVVAFYIPAVGLDHPRFAINAAQALLRATGHADPGGPWIPVGVGVHTGIAYVGSVGTKETVTDWTALGDAVNVAARLAQVAQAGEALISDAAYAASALDLGALERRRLELKGRTEPIGVHVVRASRATI